MDAPRRSRIVYCSGTQRNFPCRHARNSDFMLTGSDDMVQKGYGWMLKVAADKHQQVILNFVVKRKEVMPRTALRYAIEKMPPELKAIAIKKNK